MDQVEHPSLAGGRQLDVRPRTAGRSARTRRGGEQAERSLAEQLARLFPAGVLLGTAWALAWRTYGSIAARDWLPYALVAALVLAGALVSARARPSGRGGTALALLFGFAAFSAVTIAWAPIPSLARDEALLALLYVVALAVALVTVRSHDDRLYAGAAVAVASITLTLAAALRIRYGSSPADLFFGGRLEFPISYINAQAAACLIGFWPSIAVAARRTAPVAVRALAVGGATGLLAGWLLTQSKGGGFGLVVSAVAVFAVSRERLRLAVPVLVAGVLAAVGFRPLTAPIRATSDAALVGAIRHGGTILLLLTLAGTLLGTAYAAVDRRRRVPRQVRVVAGRAALAGVVLAVVAALAFVVGKGPGKLWSDFKVNPATSQAGGTHLLSIGSNRYDFWRVALDEFLRHPLLGTGARGFGTAYLEHRQSGESPQRAHSFEADTLSETGLVGFALLAGAVGLLLLAAARRARVELAAAGAFGGAVYGLAHSSVDWIWSFPAVGIPLFVLLGVGASSGLRRAQRLSVRQAVAAAAAVVALGLVAFVPPWLATQYNDRALKGGPGALGDVSSARTFDPLSVDPLIAASELAPDPVSAIRPLQEAVAVEPRSYAMHYLLAFADYRAGRRAAARAELVLAHRLNPGDPIVAGALRRLGKNP